MWAINISKRQKNSIYAKRLGEKSIIEEKERIFTEDIAKKDLKRKATIKLTSKKEKSLKNGIGKYFH